MDEAREQLSTYVRYGKWAGLCGAVLALIAHQQIASTWVYVRCPMHPAALVLTTAAISGFLAVATGVWSWSVRQTLRHDPDANLTEKTDRFIASVSAAFTVLAVMFIVLSSAAVLFLQCER